MVSEANVPKRSQNRDGGSERTWSLGRLVTILGGQPEIFPVNFVTQRPTVLFRTAQGTKLYSAVMTDTVAFEADYHDAELTYGWSVIVKGRARVLTASVDILDAEEGVAAVDRDVEASLRAGERLGDHRSPVRVRPRT